LLYRGLESQVDQPAINAVLATMIVRTPAERATPHAMASYPGIFEPPPSSDRNDEKKSSIADMSALLPLGAAASYSTRQPKEHPMFTEAVVCG
jgi:hypothetical protein